MYWEYFFESAADGNTSLVNSYVLNPPLGFDINDNDNDYNWTALTAACQFGHVAIVRVLLEYGAEVNIQDDKGWTALHGACVSGKAETVRLLLDKGANYTLQAHNGKTPLDIAKERGHQTIIDMLIQKSHCGNRIKAISKN